MWRFSKEAFFRQFPLSLSLSLPLYPRYIPDEADEVGGRGMVKAPLPFLAWAGTLLERDLADPMDFTWRQKSQSHHNYTVGQSLHNKAVIFFIGGTRLGGAQLIQC